MQVGITAGFGAPLDAPLLDNIRSLKWDIVRQDVQKANAATLVALHQNITAANLLPVLLCTADQLQYVPNGSIVEVLDSVDPTTTGLEPSFRVDPTTYAKALNASAGDVISKGLKAYACLTGVDPTALNWTKTVLQTLNPVYRISVHRYPPTNAMDWLSSKLGGRAMELANLKAVIGQRAFAVGEFGYHQGPVKSFFDYLLFRHHHWTDSQQYTNILGELGYWQQAGADFACVYQLNDGAPRCPEHPQYPKDFRGGYGIRLPKDNPNAEAGTWKESAFCAAAAAGTPTGAGVPSIVTKVPPA